MDGNELAAQFIGDTRWNGLPDAVQHTSIRARTLLHSNGKRSAPEVAGSSVERHIRRPR